jgi:hypothetical protein
MGKGKYLLNLGGESQVFVMILCTQLCAGKYLTIFLNNSTDFKGTAREGLANKK